MATAKSHNLHTHTVTDLVIEGEPEADEEVGEGLEASEEGEHNPVHHPFYLQHKSHSTSMTYQHNIYIVHWCSPKFRKLRATSLMI